MAELAKDNKKFNAIDRAIGKDSFKVRFKCHHCSSHFWQAVAFAKRRCPQSALQVVLLLRLSPLLPLALSNYLYGLTSVDFVPYVLGSWLGMLPGTIAYVSAGGRYIWLPQSLAAQHYH